ncbi:hypothetical protein ABW20_dc0106839 [Dactylellina cionopaga]|nr:hypothetical protein ABW20_dc0106839 [Dactylellina cionopaga]
MAVDSCGQAKEAKLYQKLHNLPRPQYPFPDLISPHLDALFSEYCQWIDQDCQFESQRARDMHKQHRLSDLTARSFPWMTLEELRPVARFTTCMAIFDDYMDTASQEEIEAVKKRVFALFTGLEDKEPEAGFYRQVYLVRQETIACGMPAHLYQEFIDSILGLMTGYGEEKQYNVGGTPPPMAVYHAIRLKSAGGICYAKYLCMQKNYRNLPDSVLNHPNILRMHSLLGLLVGYHNDFISLPKELARGGDVLNIVMVVQHEFQLGLDEACAKALEIHDEALDEFIRLQNTLPDFGEWQHTAQEYANDLGVLVQGTYSWHTQSSGRYAVGAYVEPEHHAGGRLGSVEKDAPSAELSMTNRDPLECPLVD